MFLLLRWIVSAQACVVIAIVAIAALTKVTLLGSLVASSVSLEWLLEPLLAWLVAFIYVVTGLLLTQLRIKLALLVVRSVFRTLICAMLLVLLPLWVIDRIGLLTIGSFFLIHWLSWWWVFGRKGASSRFLLLQSRPSYKLKQAQ